MRPGIWHSTPLPLLLRIPDFAKAQLSLFLREWYMHPNGQLPAYEWSFSDVNPPVHAWAAWRVFQDRSQNHGQSGSGVPGARIPQAADELHLVGEPQGFGRGTTFSRAASSAWITSASSTAAHRFRKAGCWSNRTPRAGWACTA